jgi:hypothetical protein
VIGIGIAISIAYVMSGVTAAFQAETGDTLDVLGTSFLIPDDSNGLINKVVDASDAPADTRPTLFWRDSLPDADIDLNVFGVVAEPFPVASGRAIDGPGEAVLDTSANLAIGDTLTLGGLDLEIVGLTEGTRMFGGGPVAYIEIDDLRSLYFNDQPVAHFFSADETIDAPEGLTVLSFAEAKRQLDRAVENAVTSLALTRTLLWIMVAGVILVLNRLTLIDRKSELATLKCLGANIWTIASSVVVESVLVGVLGAIGGILVGLAIAPLFPLTVVSSTLTAQQIVLLAAAVSLVAALLGTLMLRSIAPGDAFRGEV